MVSKSFAVLALASLALAHPRRGGHHSFHYGTGRGTGGLTAPTGGIFPVNGTGEFNGTGAGPTASMGSTAVMTVTVVPLQGTSTVDAGSLTSPSADAQVAASTPVDGASSSTTCTSSTTSTVIETSTQYFTVTMDSVDSSASAADVTPTTTEALAAVGSTASLTSTESVSAGAFYGRPSNSGGGYSVPSASGTTMATMASASAAASSVSWGSSAAASSTSTPSSGGSSSGVKKGLSYNSASLLSAFSSSQASWAYNWGNAPDGTIPSGMEYVPMCWGLNSVSAWSAAAAKAISSGSKHVLSFNEPDLAAQSNMSPQDAATNHIKYLNPLSGQVSIGSPAITNGAGTSPLMGVDWLNQFFSDCGGNCKVDFVAFHWYDSASNLAYFKTHVQDVINAAAKAGVSKVWLTEFGASGSDSEVATFVTEATAFLDSTAAVERYAYFMVSDGILLKGNSLSTIGQAYVA